MSLKGLKVLYLSETDVESVGLTMKATIGLIEEALRERALGGTIVPPKVFVDMRTITEHKCDADAMPGYVSSCDICGVKWIGANWDNLRKYGLANTFATIILNDPETFAPTAIMAGNWITAMRTGAATAVCAKYLGRKDPERVGIIGAGYQARYQLLALNEVLKIGEVNVFDLDHDTSEEYANEMGGRTGLKITAVNHAKDAMKSAEVIVVATSSTEPAVGSDWIIEDGHLLCSIGTYAELEPELVKSVDKIIVDHLGQAVYTGALAECFSKKLISEKDIHAELGEVIAGKKTGRESDSERILCVLTGMACEDLVIASRIHQMATEKGVGQQLQWL